MNPAGPDLNQLVAGAGDGIMVCDGEGLITLWNAAAERIFGFTAADTLGRNMDMIVPMRQRQRHWEGYAKTMATGVTRYGADVLRVPALHKDGHTLSIAFTVSMIKSSDDRVDGIVAIVRDESRRFAEDRRLRARVTELELQLKSSAQEPPA
jgi:PAS domain S-box-containing protein